MTRVVNPDLDRKAVADPNNPDPGTPATVDYEAQADLLRTMLEAFPQTVPFWQPFHPVTAQAIRGGRAVPEAFITSVADGVAATPAVQALGTFDVTEVKDMQKYKTAYQPIADLLFRTWHSFQFSIDARMAKGGSAALQTYYLTKGLGRTVAGADALAAAKAMGDALGRKGRKPKKEVPQPAPVK